jgi:hypothetical protein
VFDVVVTIKLVGAVGACVSTLVLLSKQMQHIQDDQYKDFYYFGEHKWHFYEQLLALTGS